LKIKGVINLDLDPKEKRIPISKLILGHFIEHLGRCIENGIWMYKETKRPLLGEPPLERVPADLFDVMNTLNPPIIRYPGGCFSDTYHWKDGIGPRHKRPKRKNGAWGGFFKNILCNVGPKERNHFGTDEFLTLCEKLNSATYLNINFGTGTPQEAAEWVEYANGDGSTKYGKLRIKNGHKEPYNVKYWGIANEIFGWWEKGHCKTPQQYAKKYIEFAKAMRKVDPNIKLIAVGCNKPDWNRPLLKLIKDFVDYISIHIYLPWINPLTNFLRRNPLPATEKVYYAMVNAVNNVEEYVKGMEDDIIAVLGPNGFETCKIAFDEWNIWYHWSQTYRADKPPYVLRDGLWAAGVLNMFIRHARSIGMANLAQMVNCIGMIYTYDDKVVVTPTYLVFKMYGDAWQSRLLNIEVECPQIKSEKVYNISPLKLPVLDVVATISEDGGQMTLFCINKHFESPIETSINFNGITNLRINSKIKICELYHDNPFVANTKKEPNNLKLKADSKNNGSNPYTYEFPPHSVTTLQFQFES